MNDIKHVWFDFAGTLYKETPEFNELHDQLRYKTYAGLKGIKDLEVAKEEFLMQYEKYKANSAVFKSLGQPSNFWMKALDNLDYASVLKPDPEVSETLDKLKDIMRISLFTNFVRYRVLELLTLLEVPAEYFTHLLCGEDITERKPALDGFYEMVKLSGVPADQILYIGDRVEVDIKPAKQVGINTCLLYSESPEADVCLDNFKDILSLFTS